MKQIVGQLVRIIFWRIYAMGLNDAAQIAQDYAYDIVGQPTDADPLRAMAYSPVAQEVAARNVARDIRQRASHWKSKRLWPIALRWRWRERGYAKRYDQYIHKCDGKDRTREVGWVMHLGPVKLVFG